MRPMTHDEQAALHARRPTLAAHDAGFVVDWVKREPASFPMRVRVTMSSMIRLHSINVEKTLETIQTMGIPVDLNPLIDVIQTLDKYANTLKNYCNMCGHESPDTLLYYIEQGAGIDPAFFIEAGKHV